MAWGESCHPHDKMKSSVINKRSTYLLMYSSSNKDINNCIGKLSKKKSNLEGHIVSVKPSQTEGIHCTFMYTVLICQTQISIWITFYSQRRYYSWQMWLFVISIHQERWRDRREDTCVATVTARPSLKKQSLISVELTRTKILIRYKTLTQTYTHRQRTWDTHMVWTK